ncbi:MAG: hypothetical protein AAB340_01525 [Patescibacteria group bacterium]
MAEQKELLLNKDDIRTMAKDIRRLRKFGVLEKPKQETALIQKDATEERPKGNEVIEKIIGETAKQRHNFEKVQVNIAQTNQSKNNGEPKKVESKISSYPQQPTTSTVKEKEDIQTTPKITKEISQQVEKSRVATESEQEKRKKFMDDIEKWAQEN